MKPFARFAFAALLIVSLAACGGGGEGPTYDADGNLITPATPTPPDGPYCSFPNGQNPTLVSPVPGSYVSVMPTTVTITDSSIAPYIAGGYSVEFANTSSRQDLENNPETHSVVFSNILGTAGAPPGQLLATLPSFQPFSTGQTYYAYLGQNFDTQCNANGPFGSFKT